MTAGLMLACGREFRHTAAQNWAVVDATSGYARLLLTIDTTQASTKDAFDQIKDSIEYATSIDGFPELQQTDINESGTVYQIVVCVLSLGTGGITGIVSQLGGNAVKVTLPAASWINLQQTVSIPGVSADYPILITVDATDEDNADACAATDVKAIAKTNGTVTFKCSSVPVQDVTVNVALRV